MTCDDLRFFLIIGGAILKDFAQHDKPDLLIDAQFGAVKSNEVVDINHAVGKDLDFTVRIILEVNGIHARFSNPFSEFTGKDIACIGKQFAGERVDNRTGSCAPEDARRDRKFFIILVASHLGEVIPARVEKERVDVALSGLNGRRLARAQLAVDLEQRLFEIDRRILLECREDQRVAAEHLQNLVIGGKAQRPDKGGHRQFAVFINTDVVNVVGIGFIFEPCAAVGDDRGSKKLLSALVVRRTVVNARRTHQLRNDNTLRAVDDEGSALGHQREVAHENVLLLDLPGLFVEQARPHPKRGRIGRIALLALLNRVLWLIVEVIVDKIQNQVVLIVGNGGNILKDFLQPFIQKLLVRIFLNLNQVRHLKHFIDA